MSGRKGGQFKLMIEELVNFQPQVIDGELDSNSVSALKRAVDALTVSIQLQRAKRKRTLSVGFTPEQKNKLHGLIGRIRQEVEISDAQTDKKEKLFSIIASLSKEIDRPRTGLERFGDLARGLAGISKDVEREGAQPWWPWFHKLMSLVSDAKDSEPALLPRINAERIEAPKKQLPAPESTSLDDDIPF